MPIITYEYIHFPGYGDGDHLADELIARAARRLGCNNADEYILASAGFASHAVPMGRATVALPSQPGVRRRMERALWEARREFLRRPACEVHVECVRRTRVRANEGVWVWVTYYRRKNRWEEQYREQPDQREGIDARARR